MMFVFDVQVVDTEAASYDGRHPQHILSHPEQHKRENISRLDLRDSTTSLHFCSQWTG